MKVPKKHWTTTIGQATGHPAAFGVVLLYALLWLIFDAVTFDWNAVATLGVWMMTLFIQRSNRRDTLARPIREGTGFLVRWMRPNTASDEAHRTAFGFSTA